ncbi:hypothetical protein [Acinetobacter sp.]|jgi:hypothetical protein|uniref:hypothetical protein n=1 Tax=Acinetobacter sp. TaxID=472 RepID=UPI0035AEEEAA
MELAKTRRQVLQKFKQQNFYEVKSDIESAVLDIISGEESSFNYDFSALAKQGDVPINEKYQPKNKYLRYLVGKVFVYQ